MSRFRISGVPIVDAEGRLIGIVTNRDLQFERNLTQPIREAMTKNNLVTAPVGTTLEEAERILARHRIEKLPVVDAQGVLRGLITVKDIFKRMAHPDANKDQHGRLRVAAAVGGTPDAKVRARALVDAGADVLVIDSAHGHSEGVLETLALLRDAFPDVQLVAGNVATEAGAREIVRRGADAVKVGVGPGQHLHHPRGDRRGHAAGHRHHGRGARRRRRAGHRRRRHQVFRRRGEGARLRRRLLHDGRDAGRHRGEPRRVGPRRGAALQGHPRHGEPGRHAGRLRRPLLPAGRNVAGQAGARGHRGPGALQGPRRRRHLPDGGRPPQRHGLLRRRRHRRAARDVEMVQITSAGLRESHPHDVTITREAPNYSA